ncbi:MAG: 50S ribosomal protein L11 methyltransferase, partial [Draconibacterium sp.]
ILQNDMAGKSVLDMGCGTGILGIMASMKGADKITAIDIDKWSYEGSQGNAKLNNIQNLDVKLGDAKLLNDDSYDVIFANIQRNVLLNDLPAYNHVLNNGGILIMSGFYKEDIPAIKTKAESLGLQDAGFKEKNNWVAYSFKK